MRRLLNARTALAVLLVVTAGAWVLAMLASSRPSTPVLFVYGEPAAARGAVWPVRVVAVWPSEKRTAPFEGVVVLAGERVVLEDGLARIRMPAAAEQARIVVEGEAEGVPAQTSVTVALEDDVAARASTRYRPWTAELASGNRADRAGPPLYPVNGRQPAMLPAELVVVEDDALHVVSVRPNAAGTKSPDGRALRLDATGIVLDVPVAAVPGETLDVTVRSTSPERLSLELIVNGRVRDMRHASIGGGMTTLALKLPDDASEGWFAVRASSSPLGGVRSTSAVGLILDDAHALEPSQLVERLASQPSFTTANDPLLARLLRAPPTSMTPMRALLGRLHLEDAKLVSLAPSAATQLTLDDERRQRSAARARLPFRIAGALFALLAAVVALASALENERWRQESGAGGARQLAPVGWSLLALAASLSALWVLDWVISLMLQRTGA